MGLNASYGILAISNSTFSSLWHPPQVDNALHSGFKQPVAGNCFLAVEASLSPHSAFQHFT